VGTADAGRDGRDAVLGAVHAGQAVFDELLNGDGELGGDVLGLDRTGQQGVDQAEDQQEGDGVAAAMAAPWFVKEPSYHSRP
jgi:hypothetical protein